MFDVIQQTGTEVATLTARPAALAVEAVLPERALADAPAGFAPRTRERTRHGRALGLARAIAEALFSTAEGPPPSNRLFWVERELSALLEKAGPRSGGIYKLGLYLVTWLAPLFIGRIGPLGNLPLAARVDALRRMERSFASTVVLGVKAILCVLWYEHAESAREAGYSGACADGGGR